MNEKYEIVLQIEKRIKHYFPSRWTRKDIEFFLQNEQLDLDITALQKNLNIPIRDFVLRGGKRLRPYLFLTCMELFHYDASKYLDFAALIELLHNGTLVLDDIEDKATLRRGELTCHKKFGLDTAVNVGASLHLLPLKILFSKRKDISVEKELRIWETVADELINVSFGQALDIYWHKNGSADDVSIKKYLGMVSLKTGSLMRMSTRLACILSDQDPKIEKIFTKLGETVGIAFQIIDDALDLNLPNGKFGKSYGNDITEGKLSMPVVFALRELKGEKRERLLYILRRHTKNKKLIREALSLIAETKALKRAKRYASKLVDESWREIEKSMKGYNIEGLQDLVYFLIKRDF
jgi:geranylgeranyl diphosphate synthase type I